jgi:hypothetical protein
MENSNEELSLKEFIDQVNILNIAMLQLFMAGKYDPAVAMCALGRAIGSMAAFCDFTVEEFKDSLQSLLKDFYEHKKNIKSSQPEKAPEDQVQSP